MKKLPVLGLFASFKHPGLVLALVVLLSISGARVAQAAAPGSLAQVVATTFNEQAKLTPSDGTAGDQFGISVSLSGSRALVGARLSDDNGADSGSAYIFLFDGTSWSQEAKLTPSDGAAGDFFGSQVSLSGNRALVGAPFKAGIGSHSGAAYVFVFDGSSWSQEAKLTSDDSGNIDNFGDSVSLSGNRALVGAPFNGNGAAYFFVLSGGTWSEQAKLTADGGSGFIDAVSLSGKRALLGGRGLTPANASYIFVYDGTSWSQEAKLTTGVAYDEFGAHVSLFGNRALISAPEDGEDGPHSGAAYIFALDGSTWNQEAKLTASDEQRNDMFGSSVSLSGSRALIGATRSDGNVSASGAAYLFAFDGTTWNEQSKLIASDGNAFDDFGISVSLSGKRAIVGASNAVVNSVQSGTAYLFGR